MGDMAKGVKAFKKGMTNNEDENKSESKIENNTEEDQK